MTKSELRKTIMKLLIAGSVFLIPLSAKEELIPYSFVESLCKELNYGQGCRLDGHQVTLVKHFLLDNERVLLFFTLYKPHAMYEEGFSTIAVLLDKEGTLTRIDSFQNVFGTIQRDPHGGLWVKTMIVTGDYLPFLLYSSDGTKWTGVDLGRERRGETWHKICFSSTKVSLMGTQGESAFVKSTTYADALSENPSWQFSKVAVSEIYKSCHKTEAKNNHWKITTNKREIHFKNGHTSRKLLLKLEDTLGKYTVQLGVFDDLKNIDRRWFSINDYSEFMGYYPTIIKKVQTPKGIVYKVFLDTFFEKKDAKKAMKIVLGESIFRVKEAFVTEFPKEGEIVLYEEIRKSW